jgi:pimeloyl-ACP methyl ester carboxylesterase
MVNVEQAHVVGLSMGGYTALMLAALFPERVISCTAAGAGTGSLKSTRVQFLNEARTRAAAFERTGRVEGEAMGLSPTRVHLQNKDPMGWNTFVNNVSEHPGHAAAKTLRMVQMKRASLYDLEPELKKIKAPVLLLVGDEDEPCLDVNLWMKRLMPNARLGLLPGSGHAINLEEPALFNQLVERFIVDVDRGTWQPRDPRTLAAAMLDGHTTRADRN